MIQPIIKNSYLVEVNMPSVSVGQRYYFLDVPTLRAPYVFIHGIEAYTTSQITKSPLNYNAVTPAGMTGIVCTFAVKESEEVYLMPLFSFVAGLNAGVIREFANKQINLTKSYVTILDATNLTAGESVVFNFYYQLAK